MLAQGYGSAPGKIILMGEHAVVYGQPAIAFPFHAVGVHVTIEETSENIIISSYYQGKLGDAPKNLNNIQTLVARLQTDLQTPNFTLRIESTIPEARGMGSSAAVAVAVTRAFFNWQEQDLPQALLLTYVDLSEKIAHGNPSGLDAAAVSSQQPVYFERGKSPRTIDLNMNAYLLVADTGVIGETRAAVADVAKLLAAEPWKIKVYLQQLGGLTHWAREYIETNKIVELGLLMNQAQAYLQVLTVSNERLDQFMQQALALGALGAKLTGGGRGGCFLVLTDTKEKAEHIATELLASGVTATWIQKLS